MENKLEGWQQIEEHLGMTSKTILQHGYPVRRLGRVFAYADELDAHRGRLESGAGLLTGGAAENIETTRTC